MISLHLPYSNVALSQVTDLTNIRNDDGNPLVALKLTAGTLLKVCVITAAIFETIACTLILTAAWPLYFANKRIHTHMTAHTKRVAQTIPTSIQSLATTHEVKKGEAQKRMPAQVSNAGVITHIKDKPRSALNARNDNSRQPHSTAILAKVTDLTNIRNDDGNPLVALKLIAGTLLKVCVITAAIFETIACTLILTAAWPLYFANKRIHTQMTAHTKKVAQTTLTSIQSLATTHEVKKGEAQKEMPAQVSNAGVITHAKDKLRSVFNTVNHNPKATLLLITTVVALITLYKYRHLIPNPGISNTEPTPQMHWVSPLKNHFTLSTRSISTYLNETKAWAKEIVDTSLSVSTPPSMTAPQLFYACVAIIWLWKQFHPTPLPTSEYEELLARHENDLMSTYIEPFTKQFATLDAKYDCLYKSINEQKETIEKQMKEIEEKVEQDTAQQRKDYTILNEWIQKIQEALKQTRIAQHKATTLLNTVQNQQKRQSQKQLPMHENDYISEHLQELTQQYQVLNSKYNYVMSQVENKAKETEEKVEQDITAHEAKIGTQMAEIEKMLKKTRKTYEKTKECLKTMEKNQKTKKDPTQLPMKKTAAMQNRDDTPTSSTIETEDTGEGWTVIQSRKQRKNKKNQSQQYHAAKLPNSSSTKSKFHPNHNKNQSTHP